MTALALVDDGARAFAAGEGGERDPERLGHLLGIEGEHRVAGEGEDEGGDGHPDEPAPGDRRHVIEAAEERAPGGEVEAHLLPRLAQRGGEEVGVGLVPSAAGEGHVPRPGVALPLGPLDEEHLGPVACHTLAQHGGDGGVGARGRRHVRPVEQGREAGGDGGEAEIEVRHGRGELSTPSARAVMV